MSIVAEWVRRGTVLLGVTSMALLAACVSPFEGAPPAAEAPPAAAAPEPQKDTCGAAALQGLVGQDRAAISGMRFAQVLRVFEEGQPVTMDFNPERLNIQYSKRGKIQAVTCG